MAGLRFQGEGGAGHVGRDLTLAEAWTCTDQADLFPRSAGPPGLRRQLADGIKHLGQAMLGDQLRPFRDDAVALADGVRAGAPEAEESGYSFLVFFLFSFGGNGCRD
jgi:hypothetical protein